ncbi:extracellular solute-binding protein [Actinocorallia sp. B10E7]|uniref:extracellular solute-binding protein n=1 Tax=Actinocorallia sp. B10E7 TaxID=3153558 RepID=UPI00325D6A7B
MRHRFLNSRTLIGALVAALIVWAFLFVSSRPWGDGGCPERSDRTLTVLGDKDVSFGRQRREEIRNWSEPGGMKAELRELSGVADLQHAQMAATAQDGGCGVDVYVLDGPWAAEFAEAGHLHPFAEGPLEELEKKEPLRSFLAGDLRRSGYHGGKLWAVPFSADAPLLYYRKDLIGDDEDFQKSPTWDEVWKRSEDLLDEPAGDLSAGYAAQLAPYEGFTVNLLELMRAHGGGGPVHDGQVTLDQNALREIRDKLLLTGGRSLIARDSFEWYEGDATEAFSSGKTLFLRGWPTAYRSLAEGSGPGNEGRRTDRYGVTVLPGGGVLGGQSLAIAANSPYKDEARRLILELTGAPVQRKLFWCGGFAPVRTEVYAEPTPTACGSSDSGESEEHVVRHLPEEYLPTLRRAVEQAHARPISPYYPEFSRIFQKTLHCSLRDACTERLGLEEMESRLTEALKGR